MLFKGQLHFHFHLVKNIFYFILSFLLPMCYLECVVYSSNSQGLSSYLSFSHLSFNSTVVCKDTFYDFSSFKFVKVCFIVQEVVCVAKCSFWAWEECASCCHQVECSAHVILIQLWCPYWFPACWVYQLHGYWVSNYNRGLSTYPCSSTSFCLTYFGAC